MAYGWLLQAEYASGYVLTEDERDHSPYDPGRNTFHAIMNGRPVEAGHGDLVRLSLIGPQMRYDIDWRALPDTARPVYYRQMQRTRAVDGSTDTGPVCLAHHFGYQYTDAEGRNVQDVHEIDP